MLDLRQELAMLDKMGIYDARTSFCFGVPGYAVFAGSLWFTDRGITS